MGECLRRVVRGSFASTRSSEPRIGHAFSSLHSKEGEKMLLFFKVLLTEFIAEMGDKTQLMLIALTSKYRIRDIILGTAAAILVLNGMAVLLGGLVGSLIPEWLIKLIAALAFMYFAVTSFDSEEDDEETESGEAGRFDFAPLAIAATFFVAELGDKTQLTAIAFGANEGLDKALVVWLGCSAGLFAADILGMLVGYLIKAKMPEGFLDMLAFAIFAVFGVINMKTALTLMLGEGAPLIMPLLAGITAVFAAVVYAAWRRAKRSTTFFL